MKEILQLAKELDRTDSITDKDIVKTLSNSIESVSELSDDREVEIRPGISGDSYMVRDDYSLDTLIHQILKMRIIGSSCDEIRVSLQEEEDGLLMKISDGGDTLPSDVKKIFEGKVYTGDTTGVVGFRYYVVRKIASHNLPEIRVGDSELGGASFEIIFTPA